MKVWACGGELRCGVRHPTQHPAKHASLGRPGMPTFPHPFTHNSFYHPVLTTLISFSALRQLSVFKTMPTVELKITLDKIYYHEVVVTPRVERRKVWTARSRKGKYLIFSKYFLKPKRVTISSVAQWSVASCYMLDEGVRVGYVCRQQSNCSHNLFSTYLM